MNDKRETKLDFFVLAQAIVVAVVVTGIMIAIIKGVDKQTRENCSRNTYPSLEMKEFCDRFNGN